MAAPMSSMPVSVKPRSLNRRVAASRMASVRVVRAALGGVTTWVLVMGDTVPSANRMR